MSYRCVVCNEVITEDEMEDTVSNTDGELAHLGCINAALAWYDLQNDMPDSFDDPDDR